MGILGRYILKQVLGVSALCLLTLTGILWLTQALERLDLLTSKGHAFSVFIGLTLLSLPGMLVVIAPVAFFIGCLYVLNRLNNDSELVVISASGASRWFIMRPFIVAGLIVTVLMYSATLHYVPMTWRLFRDLITEVRSDVLASVVQEGSFSSPEDGVVFHVRQRARDGTLRGLLVHDNRDPSQHFTYLAERAWILSEEDSALLIMDDGSVHRRILSTQAGEPDDTSIVTFERYALDLSQFSAARQQSAPKPRERTLQNLLNPAPDDPRWLRHPGKFRSELNERLTGPLYPLVYGMIALATIGFARSSRERRMLGFVVAVIAVLAVRLSGFSAVNMSTNVPAATIAVFAIPVVGFLVAGLFATGLLRNAAASRHLARMSDTISTMIRNRLPHQHFPGNGRNTSAP